MAYIKPSMQLSSTTWFQFITTMKIILLVISFTALAAADVKWTDWHVRYAVTGNLLGDSFYPIPLTENAALAQNWVSVDGVSSLRVTYYSLPGDPRYGVFYDSNGNIAGFQIGLPYSDLESSGSPYNISAVPMFTLQTIYGIPVWTAQCYTTDPAVIRTGGSDNTDGSFGSGGVWLKYGNDFWVIPGNETQMAATTKYTHENCVDKMGVHYYYNISKTMDCQNWIPWFLLYDNYGNLQGVGLQLPGKVSTYNRKWFEDVPSAFVKATIPNSPDCLTEWATEYGIISLHTYFTSAPWNYYCSAEILLGDVARTAEYTLG